MRREDPGVGRVIPDTEGGDIEYLTAPVGGLRLPRWVLASAAAHDACEVLLSRIDTSRAIRPLRSSQNDTM